MRYIYLFLFLLFTSCLNHSHKPVIQSYNDTTGFIVGTPTYITSPVILSVTPLNNASSVPLSITPTVTFNVAMNPSTFNDATFILKQGSTPIVGFVSYAGNTAMFTPADPLITDLLYTATITTGVHDMNGTPLAVNYTWDFITGVQTDNTPPTVLSVTPTVNATSIAVSIHPVATFSEAMNPATISTSTFTLYQGATQINGSVGYVGTSATFTPTAPLSNGLLYTATITTGVQDVAGNPLAQNYTWGFTTAVSVSVPTVTTTAITAIAPTTATGGGNVTSAGGGTITARGIVWNTTTGPTTALSTKTLDPGTTGVYTSSLTGLTANTLYYVRAYATNSAGTTYGNEVTFTTSTAITAPVLTTTTASSITTTTASSGGNVTSDGGSAVTVRGICWSTATNPTTALTTKTSDGTGTGVFTSSLTSLTPNTTYYIRAYATNSIGTTYGNQVSFTTSVLIVAPTVTTTAISSIAQTTATGGGNVTADGGATVTARGVCWSTSQNPTTASSTTSNGTGTGSFTSSITSLTASTIYYVRAYATNSAGTSYGVQVTFTTASAVAVISFANDVAPLLNATGVCQGCHNHSWASSISTNASTFYTNLLNTGKINPSNPSSTDIYSYMSSGHKASTIGTANANKILQWMDQGSLNN